MKRPTDHICRPFFYAIISSRRIESLWNHADSEILSRPISLVITCPFAINGFTAFLIYSARVDVNADKSRPSAVRSAVISKSLKRSSSFSSSTTVIDSDSIYSDRLPGLKRSER